MIGLLGSLPESCRDSLTFFKPTRIQYLQLFFPEVLFITYIPGVFQNLDVTVSPNQILGRKDISLQIQQDLTNKLWLWLFFEIPLSAHSIVPFFTRCSRSNISCPDGPIAEMLTLVPLQGIPFDHWFENVQNFWFRDRFCTPVQMRDV